MCNYKIFNGLHLTGILSLWKGFTPYYARLGPHTVYDKILFKIIIII
jgi:hypothetical protein